MDVKTKSLMDRIDVRGGTRFGFYPMIDGKEIEGGPTTIDPDGAANWALGYLTAMEKFAPEILGRRCIDKGTCHHQCKEKCFRRECCSPLTGYTGPWEYPPDPPPCNHIQPASVVEKINIVITGAMRDMLKQVPGDWDKMPHGIWCTNGTVKALKRRGLIEMRVTPGQSHSMLLTGLATWDWRRKPAAG